MVLWSAGLGTSCQMGALRHHALLQLDEVLIILMNHYNGSRRKSIFST